MYAIMNTQRSESTWKVTVEQYERLDFRKAAMLNWFPPDYRECRNTPEGFVLIQGQGPAIMKGGFTYGKSRHSGTVRTFY